VLSLRFERDPAGMMRTQFRNFQDAEAVRAFLPRPADARLRLAEVVRDQVAEYESLGQQLWESFDGPAPASATTLASVDPGPAAARLRRYPADAERLRGRSLDELNRLRRDASNGSLPAPAMPARNEPAPTPAPAVSASPMRNEPAIRPELNARNEPAAAPAGPASRNEPARPASRRLDDLLAASISPFDRCAVVALSIAPARS
jgi:hypothetical protein